MAQVIVEIIILLNYVTLCNFSGTLQALDLPADLQGPKETESIFHKCHHLSSFPLRGGKIGGRQGSE